MSDVSVDERFYVVDDRPLDSEGRVVLEDGSAVICSPFDEVSARTIVACDKRLEVRRHSELSETDQRQLPSSI